jgi:hypothetical protein
MKTDMIHKNIVSALTGMFVVSVLMIGAFSIAPLAHAQEDDGGDYGSSYSSSSDGGDSTGSCCDYGSSYSSPTDYGSSYSSDYGSSYSSPTDYGSSYSSPSDYGSSYSSPTDYGSSYSSPTDYGSSYSTPSYSTSGYSTGGYSTSGYSTGGYSTGGYSTGGYSTGGYTYTQPASTVYASTNTNTNINNNTCVGNSCNTTTTVTNPAPVINNVVANYGSSNTTPYYSYQQYCPSGYYGTYPNCYANQQVVYQAPVAYTTATPYVSLTQVPYTGLDLGFWGTIAYWGAMVLFALVAAYLIVIKRVQNVLALRLKYFLFGTANVGESEEAVVAHAPVAHKVYATAPASEDIVDNFILSQINRPRHA